MSNIFISHSSQDKSFVRKLAVDLLHEGMPVWLDEWYIEIGDSLTERVRHGIETGAYFILVISKASLASGWVEKEVAAALTRESRLKRRFLLTIVLDGSVAPPNVADRLHADFSQSYVTALESLLQRLRQYGLHTVLPSADRVVIPLTFARDTHLDTQALRGRIDHLRPLLGSQRPVAPKDLVVCMSSEYQALRARAAKRMENIADDTFYSSEFELSFKGHYRQIVDLERQYLEGVCLIINNLLIEHRSKFDAYHSLTVFSRLWRSAQLNVLYRAQNPTDPQQSEYGRDCLYDRFGSDARSYDLTQPLGAMDVGPLGNGTLLEVFRVYIDRDQEAFKDAVYITIERLLNYDASLIAPYVIPQMVAMMVEGQPIPSSWTFEGFGIGRA